MRYQRKKNTALKIILGLSFCGLTFLAFNLSLFALESNCDCKKVSIFSNNK